MPSYTRDAIKRSFLKLLNEKPYSSITVKDIVGDCGVNRNSFYYHFQDIPSLLEEITRDSCDGILRSYPTPASLEDCLEAIIAFAQANRRAALHIYGSVDRAIFERYLLEPCRYTVDTFCDTAFAGRRILPEDAQILRQYCLCTMVGQAMLWMENGMRDDLRASFRRLCRLTAGQLEELIRRCEERDDPE